MIDGSNEDTRKYVSCKKYRSVHYAVFGLQARWHELNVRWGQPLPDFTDHVEILAHEAEGFVRIEAITMYGRRALSAKGIIKASREFSHVTWECKNLNLYWVMPQWEEKIGSDIIDAKNPCLEYGPL